MLNRPGKVFWIVLFFFGMAHAHEIDSSILTPGFVKCEKRYVQPDQVAVTSEGIYFQHEDSWIMTDAIHRDSAGIYISSTSEEWSWKWKCPRCGHENSPFSRECEKCHYKPRH